MELSYLKASIENTWALIRHTILRFFYINKSGGGWASLLWHFKLIFKNVNSVQWLVIYFESWQKSVSWLNSNDKKPEKNHTYIVCTIFWGPDPRANEDSGSIFDTFHREHISTSTECLKLSGLVLLPKTLP